MWPPARRACLRTVVCAATLFAGCQSAADRCAEAQAGAQTGWSAYLAEVERLHAEAMAVQSDAQTRITGPIEARLGEAARRKADKLYDRDSSAWLRGYDASLQAACGDDEECFGLKQKSAAAKLRSDDLLPRVVASRAARDAATGARPEAQSAAAAVQDDFDRAELLAAARALSQQADERCDGVK